MNKQQTLTKMAHINQLAQVLANKRAQALDKQASMNKQAYVYALAQQLANRKALAKTASYAVNSLRSR